jgi:phosphate transport system permease protein
MNKRLDSLFKYVAITFTLGALSTLVILLFFIVREGWQRLDWNFIFAFQSRFPEQTGIYTALAGMFYLVILTICIAFPVGLAAGIYLEEYANKKNRLSRLLEINIANLAGVPSVIYGILGLEIFVRLAGLGNSLTAGALTLSLLILPVLIVSTREAIKAVPTSLREASLALGATRWQTIWKVILPSAYGGIFTGMILSVSRAIAETAPLIVVGALIYVPFLPEGILDQYTVLPLQIFNWISRPQASYLPIAAAGIIVLLLFTFSLTGIAIYFRNRWYKKLH